MSRYSRTPSEHNPAPNRRFEGTAGKLRSPVPRPLRGRAAPQAKRCASRSKSAAFSKSEKMMNWNVFKEETNFEEIIFDLTKRSIAIVLESDLEEKSFSAFAFNCSSYHGDISLSFGVNPGYEDKRKRARLYPPDWEYEVMECSIKEIGDLWEAQYIPIQSKHQEFTESHEDIENFCEGFLNSLRKVMVRLEKQGVIKKLNQESVWTLVTEIDADTGEEEQLLEKARREYAQQGAAPDA